MDPARGDASQAIVGQSRQICEIRRFVQKAAQSRIPVLLLGESGTGKEVVARAIYRSNPLGRFVPIDCGALVGTLMESELFGHVKGAFTGAVAAKTGLIELADGGTAFFDEIGDLKLELQVKLLRLLQEREFRPVGALAYKKIEIRVIAATHRDLEREVALGNFRQDLYYRLKVFTIRLPRLADRPDDIPLLADHFLRAHDPALRLTPAVREALLSYHWPGNVRELQNCIERMVALRSSTLLQAADLPSALHYHLAAQTPTEVPASSPASDHDLPDFCRRPPSSFPLLKETEKHAIMEALERTGGDRARAAQLLGIGRTTLYRKLKEYRIQP
ncbi:MAG TPA: sigma 54-interacting transcriptional regulator [Bryobacteraceae bacterium]|nr:sigma 54-interacting transcriptional regulator [Bryobacteraceae bacterium]